MKPDGFKILLVGKGAREHSLAWKLAQSPSVRHVYVVPGNGGTSQLDHVSNICSVEANDYPGLVALAKDLGIGLVVAGPDDAVVDGIEGFFRGSMRHAYVSFSCSCAVAADSLKAVFRALLQQKRLPRLRDRRALPRIS